MFVHVLLYEAHTENEGIHSIELKGSTVILMFEDIDDAERYCGLLEAQDFPTPEIEKLNRKDIELFCLDAGYEARFVEKGFIPSNDEERIMISPPQENLDLNSWKDITNDYKLQNPSTNSDNQLDDIKKRLEELL